MTPRKVVELHPPEVAESSIATGHEGKVWTAGQVRSTHEWAVSGRLPERPNSFTDLVLVRHAAGGMSESLAKEIARRLMAPDPLPHESTEESA